MGEGEIIVNLGDGIVGWENSVSKGIDIGVCRD